MAVYREELATDYSYPHIDIYRQYRDDVFNGYKAYAQNGYVFYDTNANDTTDLIDPDTGEPVIDEETGMPVTVPITYYYTIRIFPKTYNMANFSLVAVPRDSVNENDIFGGGDNNNHEVM